MLLFITFVIFAQEAQFRAPDEDAKIEQAIKKFEARQAQDSGMSTMRVAALASVMILIVAPYLLLTILATIVGSYRVIGPFWAFLISLLLTPLVGLYVVATSERKTVIEFRKKLTEEMNAQTELLKKALMHR